MKLTNRLAVIYKGKVKAGELWVDDDGYHFEYEEDFINNEKYLPVSVNMPKSQKVYHAKELFHYFKSILSEGENRERISKALRIDPSDDWNLLALTCQYDTIGAITVKHIDEGAV